MKGVFRITHAEFVKIFKKPIVYIMAFVLALVSILSIILYKPTIRTDNTIQLDADNAAGYYSAFHSSGDHSKSKTDETFDTTSKQVELYTLLQKRRNELDYAYSKFYDAFVSLQNYKVSANKTNQQLINDCNTTYETLLNKFVELSQFDPYTNVKEVFNSQNQDGQLYYKVHTIDTAGEYNYEKLFSTLTTKLQSATSPDAYIDFIVTNNYIELLKNLTEYGKDLIYYNLLDMLDTVSQLQQRFINLIANSQSGSMQEETTKALGALQQQVNIFKEKVDLIISTDSLIVLTTNSEYKKFSDAHLAVTNIINSGKDTNGNYTPLLKRGVAVSLRDSNYQTIMKNYITNLNFMPINDKLIEEYDEIKQQVESDKKVIIENINKLKTETTTHNIAIEISNYEYLSEAYRNVVNQIALKSLLKEIPVSAIRDAKIEALDLKSFNAYTNNQNISQNKYQIKNNVYSNNVGAVFSFGNTSQSSESMFDRIYSTLKICTIFIIIFTIMMISGLVTSETENGTIKLLLIRPYNRSKILIGKMLATLFFSIIFVLLTCLISGVAGIIMFKAPVMSKVLVTFNASKTFLINPILLLLLFVTSCILDIIFYLILSLTISVLFRSYVGAITTSFLVYIGAIIVGALIPNSVAYAYIPFTNISLFRFFGGELIGSGGAKIAEFFNTPVQSSQNFYTSLLISAITSIVLLTVTLVTFNRRDF